MTCSEIQSLAAKGLVRFAAPAKRYQKHPEFPSASDPSYQARYHRWYRSQQPKRPRKHADLPHRSSPDYMKLYQRKRRLAAARNQGTK